MEGDTEEKPLSQYSCHSRRSNCSSRASTHGSAVTRARAKAEAARVKASYAQREADMLIKQARIEEEELKRRAEIEAGQQRKRIELEAEQQRRSAELQANLHALKIQGAAEAAIAEAEIFEAAYEEEGGEPLRKNVTKLAPYPSSRRTSEYVQQHSREHGQQEHQLMKREPISSPEHQQNMDNGDTDNHGIQIGSLEDIIDHTFPELPAQRQSMSTANLQQSHGSPLKSPQVERRPLQTHIKPSEGTTHFMPSRVPLHDQSGTADLAKYLIRKEMVSSGLLKFDERPENYWAWKASFVNSTSDLDLTPREELDLLIKWLGPQSAEQAKRIRAVHIHNASLGLQMVWQRLEECYGSAEMIENALLKKLEEFPKISNKDNEKLRELGDLLQELEAALEKMGFYLDSLTSTLPVESTPSHRSSPITFWRNGFQLALNIKMTIRFIILPFASL